MSFFTHLKLWVAVDTQLQVGENVISIALLRFIPFTW